MNKIIDGNTAALRKRIEELEAALATCHSALKLIMEHGEIGNSINRMNTISRAIYEAERLMR